MNLDDEIRKGYLIPSRMKHVWAKEIEVFQKLFEVCNKHGIKIVATGGTCIGAVREHGFIPWDDDIDVEMLRPDYEKLVSVANEEFKAPFFFQCSRTEDNYPNGHAQLRMDGTTAILSGDYRDIHHGIYVDIFILDAVPRDILKLEEMKKKSERIKCLLTGYSYCNVVNIISTRIFYYIYCYIYVKLKGYKQLSKEYEDIFRANQIEDSDEVASMMFRWDQIPRVRRSKHMMDEILLLPFEDILMPVPAMYDQILRKHFGDYMKPSKIPAFHDGHYKLDMNISYKYYLPKMRNDMIKDKFRRFLFWKK